MSTKTEITPLVRAGVAGRVVPTSFAGPAGYRLATELRPRAVLVEVSGVVPGSGLVVGSGIGAATVQAIG
ncbi:hypothetical protein ACX9R5_07365 [Rathayibacter sp. CAU 1779]